MRSWRYVNYRVDAKRLGAYLEVLCPDCAHVRNSQYETNRIQNVGLSTSIQASDRVEALVPAR